MLSILPAIAILQTEPQIDLGFIRFIREHRGKALGDPVGKQYCRVQILPNTPTAQKWVMEAWVDPKRPGEALFWNGLTYPIQMVVGPASLDDAKKAALKPDYGGQPIGFWAPHEYFGQNIHQNPAKMAIWFMLGEIEVAQKLAEPARHYAWGNPPTLANSLTRWLAEGYRHKFSRAFLEFRDADALQALEIEATLPVLDQERHGFGGMSAKELISEVRRHMAKKPNPRAETKAEMIRNLEDLNTLGWWIGPGPLVLGQIHGQGPEIVPELIHAFKTDRRLTRARDWTGSVATVASVASAHLRAVWPEVDRYLWLSEEVMLARWHQHRNLSSGERLLAMVEDPEISRSLTGLVLFLNSDVDLARQKRTVAQRLEIERLRPQIREVLRKHAKAALVRVENPVTGERDFRQTFRDELQLVTAISSWDYDAGGESLRALVKMSIPGWDMPGSVQPKDMLASIRVGVQNQDLEILAAYRRVCARRNEREVENLIYYALPGFQKPTNSAGVSIARGAMSEAESVVRYSTQPDRAVRLIHRFFGGEPSEFLSHNAIRQFLKVALESRSYILVEGGPHYRKILSDGLHFSLNLPKGGPDLMRLFVRDLTAHYLCDEFDTGVEFSFYESEETRAKKRRQVQDWLSELPNEPVKRKEPDFLRRPTSRKAISNSRNR